MKKTRTLIHVVVLAVLVVLQLSCGGAPIAPPEPMYTPSYVYTSAGGGGSHDVTIAIINPVVKGSVRGADGEAMLHALPTALVDLVTAKGMKYRGPVETRESMTFPDKKGSDLGLYAEIDIKAGWEATNVQYAGSANAWSGARSINATCDVMVSATGTVSFVVIEPMSNETLWRKTVQLPPITQPIPQQEGASCTGFGGRMAMPAGVMMPGMPMPPNMPRPTGGSTEQSPPGVVGNTYRKALEAAFQATLKGIDTYMNVEEFELLKKQAAELKAKKVY